MNNENRRQGSFKNKVLFPVVAIFSVSILIISAINYAHLHSTIKTKTIANLEIFTIDVLLDIRHLHVIMETAKQTLTGKHIAIAKTLTGLLEKMPELKTHEELKGLASSLDAIEINIVNQNGINRQQ